MEIEEKPIATSNQPFTILRIKRKRNEEPLDALVVESVARKKKSRPSAARSGYFQFAQTIDNVDWDELARQRIQDQIALQAQAAKNERMDSKSSPQRSSPVASRPSKDDHSRRYMIVQPEQEQEPAQYRARPEAPPKVLSTKDIPPVDKKNGFKMYDAVLASNNNVPDIDPEMEKFMPMLNDYLKLHDIDVSGPTETKAASTPTTMPSRAGDYVWDIFYHRPATLEEWNSAAINIGTLTGLPASTNASDESDSDSAPEDEADEDSNDEDYYKNDYPDEESSSESDDSDMFHEESSQEDNDLSFRDRVMHGYL